MDDRVIVLVVNGDTRQLLVSPSDTLLDVLRGQLRLKGTKEGCTTGSCGVCTINDGSGWSILSCLTLAVEWDGQQITTIEGLERSGELSPLQKAFVEHHAVQCGYCTPGVIMSARGLLHAFPNPSDEEIDEGLAGALCRCTGHIKVKQAIRHVRDFETQARGDDAGAASKDWE